MRQARSTVPGAANASSDPSHADWNIVAEHERSQQHMGNGTLHGGHAV